MNLNHDTHVDCATRSSHSIGPEDYLMARGSTIDGVAKNEPQHDPWVRGTQNRVWGESASSIEQRENEPSPRCFLMYINMKL